MKKTLLAAALFTAMGVSGVANAAFVESTTGTASYNLAFSGTVVDTRPVWAWEVPDASKTAMTGLNNNISNGVVSGDNTSWTFASKDAVTLIHGYMKTNSVTGGVGLTPVIKVGADGAQVTMNGTAQKVTVVAAGKVGTGESATNTAGTFSINATAYLGGALFEGATPKYFGATQAQTVLSGNQTGFTTTYPSIAAGTSTFAQAEALLANVDRTKVSGAYTVSIDDYSVTFPSANKPTTWTAIVPVTVTLK